MNGTATVRARRAWREVPIRNRAAITAGACLLGVAGILTFSVPGQIRGACERVLATAQQPLQPRSVQEAAAQRQAVESEARRAGTGAALLGLGLAAFGAWVAWRLAGRVSRPFSDAVVVLQAVSAGDLTPRLEDGRGGESAQLAQALNATLDEVRDTMKVFAEHAWEVASASEGMTTVGSRLKDHAEHASSLSAKASQSTEEVNRSLHTVASGVEEMTASISEIAKNAGEAARIAASAVQVTDSANAIFLKLGESSAEIGKVLKVITSIAEQTNMLALNATIEAARAGEAGRGFAVVANEVKELARQAARAAEDIAQKVQAIQSDTSRATEAIGQIDKTINHISDIQVVIASSVEEQTATTSEIGRSIAEVARTSSGIGEAISGVATAARETLEGARGRLEAEEELARSSARMRAAVGRFRY